jgi:hypothetical protein
MSTTPPELTILTTLSRARMATYEIATTRIPQQSNPVDALALYGWNAQVSSALLLPLHMCEVVIRNAVSDALELVYGAGWPWSPGLLRSLPMPQTGYRARSDLHATGARFNTTGKVIPELKFIFWQTMFTSRFDKRLWSPHLAAVLPHHDPAKSIADVRDEVYKDLEVVRQLRNRIAHHEPIFKRNLLDDLGKVEQLIGLRCPATAAWMRAQEDASRIIALKPWTAP